MVRSLKITPFFNLNSHTKSICGGVQKTRDKSENGGAFFKNESYER